MVSQLSCADENLDYCNVVIGTDFNDHLILRVQIFARASDGEKKTFVINVELPSAFVFCIVRGQDHSYLCIPPLSRQEWANIHC